MTITEDNCLQVLYPDLASEWHPTKNEELLPNMVSAGSHKKVWWQCEKGHEWQAIIKDRKKRGCPICSGHTVLKGFNDLASKYTNLAEEWHPDKNFPLLPSMVTAGSNKKVWWMCIDGHEWKASIHNRVRGAGCPYCSGRFAIRGINDFATINPDLLLEWHPTKNGEVNPYDIKAFSNKKVWWICEKGHEWQAFIYTRTWGVGCPQCSNERKTSFPEQAILYYVKLYFPDAVGNCKTELGNNTELDIYIPSLRVAIEYDGAQWHKNSIRDIKKNILCSEAGIHLIRVREKGLPMLENCDCIVRDDVSTDDSLELVIRQIINKITTPKIQEKHKIDIQNDRSAILSLYAISEKNKSLALLYPDLCTDWHPTKNGKLLPSMVTPRSDKKVWWKCNRDHEWTASISNRVAGSGCPICAGRVIKENVNDLASIHPQLAKEWHPSKNHGLSPSMVSANSGKRVWWLCKFGHEWQTSICHRSDGEGCPYCAGKRVLEGYNDLATMNPQLSSEWNMQKNGVLLPSMVTSNSGKKVWWKCKNGHEWQATIYHRTHNQGCPYCSGRRVLKGFNDLETTNPILAKEWNTEKNNVLKPSMVAAGSNKKVWWKCDHGHEWMAVINGRNRGNGCPICAKRKNTAI